MMIFGSISLGTAISAPAYTLWLDVLGATNLKPMDRDGAADAYVEIQVNSQDFQTNVVYDSLNPNWSSQFVM